jgi:hypothetical protein
MTSLILKFLVIPSRTVSGKREASNCKLFDRKVHSVRVSEKERYGDFWSPYSCSILLLPNQEQD